MCRLSRVKYRRRWVFLSARRLNLRLTPPLASVTHHWHPSLSPSHPPILALSPFHRLGTFFLLTASLYPTSPTASLLFSFLPPHQLAYLQTLPSYALQPELCVIFSSWHTTTMTSMLNSSMPATRARNTPCIRGCEQIQPSWS